ncbi:MAG: hypothetical protein R3A11_01730 [Bdellovibrionota bacterium]
MLRRLSIILCTAVGIAMAIPAMAADSSNSWMNRRLVGQYQRRNGGDEASMISREEAKRLALVKFPGRVIWAKLVGRRYFVRIKSETGQIRDIEIDAYQ